MTTKKVTRRVSKGLHARRFLEELNGGPLTFGQTLNTIRLCDEFSLAEMALKLNISRTHLCDIEKGRRTVTPEGAARFAMLLGYSPVQFVRLVLQDMIRETGLRMTIDVRAA